VRNLASVCRTTHRVVIQRIFLQAQAWGYKGGEISEGYHYCQEMVQELKSADLPFKDNSVGHRVSGVYEPVWAEENRLKRNLFTINHLDQDYILWILESKLIYQTTAEKTRKFILSAYELFLDEPQEVNRINLVLTNAVIHDKIDVASFALKLGADPNSAVYPAYLFTNIVDDTQLHHAMTYKVGIDMISLLLESGANINAQNNWGATLLVRRLTNYVKDDITQEATVKFLLEQGADPNISDQDAVTPLSIVACTCERRSIMLTLLKHGAQVNQPGVANRTPLHQACSNLDLDKYAIRTIHFIFDLTMHGADWLAVDNDGHTPLYELCTSPPVVITAAAGVSLALATVTFKIARWQGFI
jgi:hypothetical protein